MQINVGKWGNFNVQQPQNVKQATPKQALVICIILAIVGAALLIFWGIPTVQNSFRSRNWPTVAGEIVVSKVTERESSSSDGSTSFVYHAEIAYSYNAEGVKYSSGKVAFGDYDSSSISHAQNIVNKYPVGKQVTVYYDPASPSTAVLEPGANWSGFMVAGISALFAVLGLLGAWHYGKVVRRGEEELSPPPSGIA